MKKVLSIILATVIVLGAACMVGCAIGESGSTNGGTPNNNASVQSVRMAMGSPMTLTASNGAQYVEKNLTATVRPSTADQRVDFSVAWGDGAALASEPVTDYVTVTQTTDGSTSAKVRCYKNFGEDTIVITCRTRDGGFSDTCNVKFIGFCSDITLDASGAGITKKSGETRGEYYELMTGTTYNIPIELGNIFGYVGTSDLSVALGGSKDSIGFVNNLETSYFSRKGVIETVDISDCVSQFLTASIEGNVLKITTSDKYIFSGDKFNKPDSSLVSIHYESNLNASFQWKEQGIVKTAEELNAANAKASAAAYFTVTVTDNITGTAQTIKVWVESSVTDVILDNSTLQF